MSKINLTDLPRLAEKLNMNPEVLENFLFSCRVRNLTTMTMHGYAERISKLMHWSANIGKDLIELTKRDIQNYITAHIDRVSPSTINGRIAVFKVLFRHLKTEGFVESDIMIDIKKLKEPKRIKPVLSPEQIQQILKQLNRRTFHGTRDFAMILLTFDSMIRLNELLTIKISQLDLNSGLIKVFGKGRKERNVGYCPNTAKVLHTYLTRFRKYIAGDLLFCQKTGKPIDFRRGHRIFSIPGEKAGLKFYPHLARHSGATHFAREGGSLAVLQLALGHSSLAVTEKYIHLNDKDILSAYERFSPAAQIKI